jgi:hypothetical protein
MAMTTMCVAIDGDVRQRLRNIGGDRAIGKTITTLLQEHESQTSLGSLYRLLKDLQQKQFYIDDNIKVLMESLAVSSNPTGSVRTEGRTANR